MKNLRTVIVSLPQFSDKSGHHDRARTYHVWYESPRPFHNDLGACHMDSLREQTVSQSRATNGDRSQS
jgi:hypothetical protein